MTEGAGKWRVQVGKDKGSYKDRYTFPLNRSEQAVFWYNGINVHSGYKKRLVNPEGVVIRKELT